LRCVPGQYIIAGIIDGDYTYLAVDSVDGEIFQVANMDTCELRELMNMYNRSCSHIDFMRLLGPQCTRFGYCLEFLKMFFLYLFLGRIACIA